MLVFGVKEKKKKRKQIMEKEKKGKEKEKDNRNSEVVTLPPPQGATSRRGWVWCIRELLVVGLDQVLRVPEV